MKSRTAFMIIVFILCTSMITGKSRNRKTKLKKKSKALVAYQTASKTNSTLLVGRPNIFRRAAKGIKKVGKKIAKGTKKIGKKIQKLGKTIVKGTKKMKKIVKKPLKKKMVKKPSLLRRAVSKVGGAIKRTARKVKEGIKKVAHKVGRKIKKIGGDIKKKAHKMVKGIKRKISKKKKLHNAKKKKFYRKKMNSKKLKRKSTKKIKKSKHNRKNKHSLTIKTNKKKYRMNRNQCTSSFLNTTEPSYSDILDIIYSKGKTLINPKHSSSFSQCIDTLRNQELHYTKLVRNFYRRYRSKKQSDKSSSKLIKKLLSSIEVTYSSILNTDTVLCRQIEFNLLKTKPKLTTSTTEAKPSPIFLDALYSTHRNMLSDKDFSFLNQH